MTLRIVLALCACVALTGTAGCNRNVEPFDPNERVEEPDLSRIFPPGAERAARREPGAAAGEAGAAAGAAQAAPAASEPPAAPPDAASASAGAPLRGTLELAPELAGRVPRGAVLFVIARRAGVSAGPPVAVKRVPEPRFPLEFTIGPEDRMIQAMPFSGPFELSARVDADGSATTRASGDLAGAAEAPVQPGESGIRILIDRVL